jgi:hypothetical protein
MAFSERGQNFAKTPHSAFIHREVRGAALSPQGLKSDRVEIRMLFSSISRLRKDDFEQVVAFDTSQTRLRYGCDSAATNTAE